ncbi:Asp23/Gls24 family envelope stress response protein [Enterococcus sp.]|uniref:Asp23/Gls24 family envelope stress response protein n=1 Tax=Enterococcus sp. TaxID=35783 RepID=UPI00290E5FD5|nr:Asp23/Gls24 family envelope stress response protein [Enterococcus sp.]MDU5333138.1 Asp23/Gls24 family envelope stress response protein [Enterococcus sp.]
MENTTMKNVTNTKTDSKNIKGELTYEDKVVQKIIGIALENIDGLLTVDGGFFSNMKEKLVNTDDVTAGISTEVGKKQVAVDMDIVVEYGKDVEEVFDQMKELISKEVEKMTHLEVIEVNVNVVDIKTRQEYEEDSETVQDKVSSAAETTGKFASKQTNRAKNAISNQKDKASDQLTSEPRVQ